MKLITKWHLWRGNFDEAIKSSDSTSQGYLMELIMKHPKFKKVEDKEALFELAIKKNIQPFPSLDNERYCRF